jgi:riboflavin biosynthesis pyrimidine reductase
VDASSPIPEALTRLAARGLSSLIVEGGATLHRAFWDAGVVDLVQIFIGPDTLGPGGVPWLPFALLAEGGLRDVTARTVGGDVMIEAYVHRPH